VELARTSAGDPALKSWHPRKVLCAASARCFMLRDRPMLSAIYTELGESEGAIGVSLDQVTFDQ
jgi:hypothetical protein